VVETLASRPPHIHCVSSRRRRRQSHLIELEAMGYTIVDDAIPPALLRQLKVRAVLT
jgi:hypothetical protein